ncbi:MAG: HEAT repeat domain-containing protein [Deltaproteobacteria bacterium]|nr:HEAT repeat domain-containing protein [Deltaproteobacteria bacterium]
MEDTQKIDLLIESLRHPEKKVIRQAAERLIAMAPQVPELASKLNRLLTITPNQYRWPIAYVLAQISAPSPPCLEVLKETLGSGDSDIRWAAAVLLVRLGNADKGVTASLRDLLRTGTPTQRRMAVYCLRDIDQDEASLEALLESLHDPDPLVRVAAVTSLKVHSRIGKERLDLLLRLFQEDPDPRVRRSAALALARLGPFSDEIRLALNKAALSQDPYLRKAAQAALDLLQKKGPAPTDK